MKATVNETCLVNRIYNMKNIFLQILYTECGGETISSLFYKKSK